jgi:citrate/tricarballylate utilization protein
MEERPRPVGPKHGDHGRSFSGVAVFNQFDWNATADFRDTSAMGMLLVIHLGVVAGFFLTAPYGKFAHVVYRYAALVRYSIEQQRN